MDKRFKNLEHELKFESNKAQMDSFFNEFDSMMLDNAFVEANSSTQYPYASVYWANFKNQEPELVQNNAFAEAAGNYTTVYNPAFWDQAHEALVTEGLHYQYKTSYWGEAEKLLKAADKKVFFQRWTILATSLLIIGLISGSLNIFYGSNYEKSNINTSKLSIEKLNFENNLRFTFAETNNKDASIFNNTNRGRAIENRPATTVSKKNLPQINHSNIIPNSKNSSTKNNISIQINESEKANSENQVPTPIFALLDKKSNIKIITESINKISIAPHSSIPLKFNNTRPTSILPIGIRPKKIINPFQFVMILQSGIGNSLTSGKFNHRISADLGLEYNLKKVSFSFTSGVDYENLNNYTDRNSLIDYNRSGRINHLWYAYEFKNIIKWQNSLLVGYQISKRINIKTGFSFDSYIASKLKVIESINNDLNESPTIWGRNDLFNNHDVQINGRIEYRIMSQFSIIASTEIGLLEKTSQNLTQSFKNKNILIGIKYLPFRK